MSSESPASVRPLSAFSEGAIGAIKPGTPLDLQLQELGGDYPISVFHRRLIRKLGGEFVFARRLSNAGHKWLVLVRFGRVIENRFGFAAEVPLVYDHHNDLQTRTIDSIPTFLNELPNDRLSVERGIYFLSTPDPRGELKILRASSPERLLIPMPNGNESTADELLQKITRQIFSRDLYRVQGAVTGKDFFGRQKIIHAVTGDLQRHQVPGIFGMRKSGKTSLIKQLIETCRTSDRRDGRNRIFVYQDLEHLSGFEDGDPVSELVADITQAIWDSLRKANLRTKEVAELSTTASLPEFRTALDALLNRIGNAEIVLVLDEVEYLCPPNAEKSAGTPSSQKVPQLFGVFRKLVQERTNFGLIIAGLASATVEASELFGRTNPLFSFANPYYLGPFDDDEARTLIIDVGRQVGLRWDDDAIDLAISETGGNPMMLRAIGSSVMRQFGDDRTEIASATRPLVVQSLDSWRRDVSGNLREVVKHLQRFYPDENDLIDLLMTSPSEFEDLAYGYPDQVNRLLKLGVIQQVESTYIASRVLQMGWELITRPTLNISQPKADEVTSEKKSAFDLPLSQLVLEQEGLHVERKETFSLNKHTGSKDDDIVLASAKTIAAFMNSEGGVLVIGIHDKGEVIGIIDELGLAHKDRSLDGFERFVNEKLLSLLGKGFAPLFSIEFSHINGRPVCGVRVKKSDNPVYLGTNHDFYIRTGNSTQKLTTKEANEYLANNTVRSK